MARAQRARGDGSIWKTGDRWRCAILVDGKRITRNAAPQFPNTRDGAAKRLRELEREHRDTGMVAGGRGISTVAEQVEHVVRTADLAVSTRASYASALRRRIRPYIGDIRLDRLCEEDLERWHQRLLREQYSTSSIHEAHTLLQVALKVAVQRRRIGRNVAVNVRPPTVVRPELESLLIAEAKAVLTSAASDRHPARWYLALSLGLRQGECLGLCWDCVDLDAGTVTVRRKLQRWSYPHGCQDLPPDDGQPWACGRARGAECPQRGPGGLILHTRVKSKAGRRTLALEPAVVAALRAERARQAGERLAAGSAWVSVVDTDRREVQPVFTSKLGRPLDPRRDHDMWDAILAASTYIDADGVKRSVRDAVLHQARHTFCTLLHAEGAELATVQAMAGHASLSQTREYTHVVPAVQEKAAKALGAALFG